MFCIKIRPSFIGKLSFDITREEKRKRNIYKGFMLLQSYMKPMQILGDGDYKIIICDLDIKK
jgi:hypothetical protein